MRKRTRTAAVTAAVLFLLAGCTGKGGTSSTGTATPDKTPTAAEAPASKTASPGLLPVKRNDGPVTGLTNLANETRTCARGYDTVELPADESGSKQYDGGTLHLTIGKEKGTITQLIMRTGKSDRRVVAVVVNGYVGGEVSARSESFSLSPKELGSDSNGTIFGNVKACIEPKK